MKKFKCYNCGTISSIEDGASKATCPHCGTICSLLPAPQSQQQSAQAATQQQSSSLANVDALNSFLMKQSAINHFEKYIYRNDFGNVVKAIMKAPLPRVSSALRVTLKSPLKTRLYSYFFGMLGVDRFYIGDVGLGVCKLLFGVLTLFIWPIVDFFICSKRARKKNYIEIMKALGVNLQQ